MAKPQTDALDASVLLMPLCKFIAPTDPRWLSTLDAITAELVSDSLVYRYDPAASPANVPALPPDARAGRKPGGGPEGPPSNRIACETTAS